MDPNQIMLGKYSLPFILSMILGMIYKRANVANDLKPAIAAACGVALGVAAMFYNEPFSSIAFPIVADYVLAGGLGGMAATGIHEFSKEGRAGRQYVALGDAGNPIAGAKVAKVRSKIL
jgi:hypothetical protein